MVVPTRSRPLAAPLGSCSPGTLRPPVRPGRRRVGHAAVIVVVLAVSALLGAAPPASADPGPAAVTYTRPVPGPVLDPFRLPSGPYGAGNRGVELATVPGDDVHAAAGGEVTFAGSVAGALHVVVLHADGLRTSYSFLASVRTRRGAVVAGGDVVGTAASSVHWGVRRGEEYLDPLTLLDAGGGPARRAHLVPDGPAHPLGEDDEVAGLRRLLAGSVPRLAAAAGVALTALPAGVLATLGRAVPGVGPLLGFAGLVQDGLEPPQACSAPTVSARHPDGPRRLVLVAGLGSSSTSGAVADVDAAALGYGPGEVVRFSYADAGGADTAADTLQGVAVPGARLAALLGRLATSAPGTPVDVVAHSMGGLVVRAALARPGTPPPATVVTLATPHRGAPLAAYGSQLADLGRLGLSSPQWEGVTALLRREGIDPGSLSVDDLAPASPALTALPAAPVGVGHVATIGARTDVVVPHPSARWAGTPGTVVDLRGTGLGAHGALPGSAPAAREIALAVAGLPPTCRSAGDRLLDALVGAAVVVGTALGAAALAPGALAPVVPVVVPVA